MSYSEKLIVKLALEIIPEPPKELTVRTRESKLIYGIFQGVKASVPDFLKQIVERITFHTINSIETKEENRIKAAEIISKLKKEIDAYAAN